MINQAEMGVMEEIIVGYAGPLGSFIIKKAIADIGADPTTFDEETVDRFIDLVIKRSIFDRNKWKSIKEEILIAWSD
ncbi:MAG: hypothetical protein KAX31_05470 [Thermoplasmata archaeon]|nr:hypothetical protein [Thermoplasmata archaeon]